jgi:hypothetical protein
VGVSHSTFLSISVSMSIALCVIVRPSRAHHLLLGSFGLVLLAAALAVGLAASGSYPGGPWLALLPALAGACLLRVGLGPVKTHRIDISGTGEIRLTVQQGLWMRRRSGPDPVAAPAVAVVLLPGSVVWPPLMLLRLLAPGGRAATVLPVWRDSIAPDEWRRLGVAIHAIGRRAKRESGNEGYEKIR